MDLSLPFLRLLVHPLLINSSVCGLFPACPPYRFFKSERQNQLQPQGGLQLLQSVLLSGSYLVPLLGWVPPPPPFPLSRFSIRGRKAHLGFPLEFPYSVSLLQPARSARIPAYKASGSVVGTKKKLQLINSENHLGGNPTDSLFSSFPLRYQAG